ncbi:MAG TPA: DUF6194 family protein [Pseudonocardiaceae bacterium]|jgi:hypothetical protein|nr:DUF6194 family protein [Pseudonocardiaceae bacterium]
MDASRPGMDDLIALISSLPGVDPLTADATSGAPEIAWGDSFFYYDPDRDQPADRRMPFATIVTKDYPGFDTESRLDRPGVFRLNISVGRDAFARLLGYPPAAHAEQPGIDYAVLDRLLPHPVYAVQSWVSVLNPGPDTAELVRSLLTEAHARAMRRHRTTTV